MKSYQIIFCVGIIGGFLSACQTPGGGGEPPRAQKGHLDLQSWDFVRYGNLNLDGQWHFAPQKLLSPRDNFQFSQWATVPELWHKGWKPGFGYGTYQLVIALPHEHPPLSIRLNSFGTAYRFFVNERELAQNGQVGRNYSETIPYNRPLVCEVDANTHEIILRVQVANFHHRYGGFWQSIQLGPTQTLTQTRDRLVAIELLLAGCLLIMSLYHLGVYMFRQQDRSALYFSLVSLLFVVHTLITNERYLLQIFPQLPWAVSFRAEYLAMYLGFPYYIMFFHSVYPQEFSGRVREGVRIVGFGLSALVVLLPTYIFSYTTEAMQVVMAGIGLYILYVLIKAVRRGRETSKIFLLGFLFFAASLVNDSLYANHWIETGKWASFGFLIFTISQSIVLSIRFARSFSAIEEMSHDLEQRVQKRTEEISRQNQELELQKNEIIRQNQIIEKKNQNITASITYASRIQKAIIGNEDAITSNFKESFIFIKPKDIVSGDFYWFTEVKRSGSIKGGDDRQTIFFKIIAAADCTGHGIPGAFMTVMGNALLDEIINENKVTNPSRILSVLDRKLLMKLQQHNVNDGMDMALLVFDDENQRVSFSGANNPLYYVRQGQIHQIKGSKFPIGSAQYRQKKKFDLHHIDYLPGDVYYIFSDGFQDQFGGELGQKYYKKRFREFLLAISQLPLKEQKKHLEDELRQWQGEHPQTDDILIIGIRT